MRLIDLRGTARSRAELIALAPRAREVQSDALAVAERLVADVRERGEDALREQAAEFDLVSDHAIRVPLDHRIDALEALDAKLKAVFDLAIARVRAATALQVPTAGTIEIAPGAFIHQRWQPVSRAGLYVPGGRAVYPSSVIMNVVAAQVAGVDEIALASPPQTDGRVHPAILAVAEMLGVSEVYAIGGAGAIGALAYGVDSLELDPVDVVTGPGNRFVAAAKRAVSGVVGIDSEAGTTEILIAADASADARLVALDLISQAEHDPQAAAVLVTDSEPLARVVEQFLDELVPEARHAERIQTALDGEQSAIVLVDDFVQMVRFTNAYAPEHLELHLADAKAAASHFTNAGAVFLGAWSPVSLGDYVAGSNHVLPVGGTARYASGLGAHTFLRAQQLVEYDRAALTPVADATVRFAEAEDLPSHGAAVAARVSVEASEAGS